MKVHLLESLPFWVGAVLTGFVSVVYTKIFYWAEQGTLKIFYWNKWLFFILTPLCFVIGWWVTKKYSPTARGSGIPQVSAAIELANRKDYNKVGKLLGVRILFVKIISSCIVVFGGGVTGREGPTIQIAASIFKKINSLLPTWFPKVSKKNMIVTGAGAGLAAAFNTPLGGIVFTIEELTKTYAFSYFRSALITGVIIAGFTALSIYGPYLYLGIPQVKPPTGWIIFSVVLVSILSGYGSSISGTIILQAMKYRARIQTDFGNILYCVVGGLIIAALGVFVSVHTFGSGKEVMQTALLSNEKYAAWYEPLLRCGGTIITFSNGGAGGIFAPFLSTGASVGSALSNLLQMSPDNSNLIMLCGMVAALTGITRSPFTSTILVVEMTNANTIIFYLMFAALTANLIASVVDKKPFYEHLKDSYLKEVG